MEQKLSWPFLVDGIAVNPSILELGGSTSSTMNAIERLSMNAMNSSWPQMSYSGRNESVGIIETPGPNDVLCGRGSATNGHIGNRRFRNFVKKFETTYHTSCKAKKATIVYQIVQHIRTKTSPPGRFLMKHPSVRSSHGGDVWYEIDTHKAAKKVSQRLREKTVKSAISLTGMSEQQKKEVSCDKPQLNFDTTEAEDDTSDAVKVLNSSPGQQQQMVIETCSSSSCDPSTSTKKFSLEEDDGRDETAPQLCYSQKLLSNEQHPMKASPEKQSSFSSAGLLMPDDEEEAVEAHHGIVPNHAHLDFLHNTGEELPPAAELVDDLFAI